ncbi:type VI secretion system protein TssA [Geoalkalibacter halelectricus]|uniref:Type VI secretion system protein TssA n=1 Tax=Geoalkalibacter halelectricus TaxID=2847045 RepID=A0ABY5ZRC9_9BACT|nr:type VI secretion system protein TssA [Geoalkalibacter halelectricus]MDO3379322.1 type VI secretion system protein TssA [Geoalkalibacter halelectricus]UWZ81074.1 type VI secretion system protein TssA [Geoalkalibacter halelectricus]
MSMPLAHHVADASLLDAVLAPLPQGGEDPRYCEEFLLAKREIDKLRENQYAQVHTLCCGILSGVGKDLRVAGFLLMACLGRDGLGGLMDGAAAYLRLLEEYWEECHPRKDNQRISALAWLNGARLEAMAREAGRSASPQDLERLRYCVDGINALLRARIGAEAPQWQALDAWLKIKSPSPERPAEKAVPAAPVDPPPASRTETAPEEAKPVVEQREPQVGSEREAFAMARILSDYYRAQGHWQQALAFTRALRWGGANLPPQEQGRTRVPAPRATAVTTLERQRQQSDPQALLELCESLFLEPGGQFWLDLQYLARQAAHNWGRAALQDFIDEQTRSLLRRLPGLEALSFDDGRPFADSATRAWLAELCTETAPPATQDASDEWDVQLAEALKTAREHAARNQLGEALNLLRALPAPTKVRRMRLELAQAALCLQGGRADIALPLAESLEAQSETLQMRVWNEGLALEIWRLGIDIRRQCLPKAAGEAKAALETQIRRLHAQICRTDPAVAVKWL